jgi:hypothetical protein
MNRRNFQHGLYPIGAHSELTTSGSVQTLTRPSGADGIIIQNVGSAILLYTLDESNPDADTGFRLYASSYELRIDLNELDIKVWLVSGAVLQYQWFRYLG